MSNSQTVSASSLRGCSEELGKGFWQQWQQYQDYLHRCCIKWMGGNPTDAEDALSRAMLKAWEKVQQYAGKITNFKSWLTSLTHNLCVDILRERSRGANRVEDIEGYARSEEEGLVRSEDTPEIAMETGEKRIVIRRAIDNLPPRLRETFILHFYQELSYPEIAQRQEISYQNVCKRISQARKILQEELRGYFIEEEGTDRDKSVPPTATESPIEGMSEGNAGVEAGAEETVTLSVAVEEVESVGGSEAIEVARDVQHSESVMVAATNDGKLEVKSDDCRCVAVALCERQFAPILALAQFDEETGDEKANSGLPVLRMLDLPDVEERGGNFATVSHSEFLSSSQFSIPSLDAVETWLCQQNQLSIPKSVHQSLKIARQVKAQDVEVASDGSSQLVCGVAKDRRISVEDLTMRHDRKSRYQRFDGYKRHVLTDLDTGLVRAVGMTPANVPQAWVSDAISADIKAQGVKLVELHIDRAYLSSKLVRQRSLELNIYCKAWSVRNRGRHFSKSAFELDWQHHTLTCPNQVSKQIGTIKPKNRRGPLKSGFTEVTRLLGVRRQKKSENEDSKRLNQRTPEIGIELATAKLLTQLGNLSISLRDIQA
jgi:RNA polymerase sigma-70 factor (ECF subfamily)